LPFLSGIIWRHLPIFAHFHGMNLSLGSACPVCMEDDDLEHLLFRCVKYSKPGFHCIQQMGIDRHDYTMQFIYDAFKMMNFNHLYALDNFFEQSIYRIKKKFKRKINHI
jgi:hypothetical protein